MTEQYFEKGGRRQWRTYCDTCHALLGDTGPMKDHLPWGIGNECPHCHGKIFDDKAKPWSPPIRD